MRSFRLLHTLHCVRFAVCQNDVSYKITKFLPSAPRKSPVVNGYFLFDWLIGWLVSRLSDYYRVNQKYCNAKITIYHKCANICVLHCLADNYKSVLFCASLHFVEMQTLRTNFATLYRLVQKVHFVIEIVECPLPFLL